MKVIYLRRNDSFRAPAFYDGFYFFASSSNRRKSENTQVNVASDANGVLFATTFSNSSNSDATSKTSLRLMKFT